MLAHRLLGTALAAFGLVLLFGQLVMLYGATAQELLVIEIGRPGLAILSGAGALCFAMGCLLAAAPRTTVYRLRCAAGLVRRAS
jgi:hypothetical protein